MGTEMTVAFALAVGVASGAWLMIRFQDHDKVVLERRLEEAEEIMTRQAEHIQALGEALYKVGAIETREDELMLGLSEYGPDEDAIDWSAIGLPGGRTL